MLDISVLSLKTRRILLTFVHLGVAPISCCLILYFWRKEMSLFVLFFGWRTIWKDQHVGRYSSSVFFPAMFDRLLKDPDTSFLREGPTKLIYKMSRIRDVVFFPSSVRSFFSESKVHMGGKTYDIDCISLAEAPDDWTFIQVQCSLGIPKSSSVWKRAIPFHTPCDMECLYIIEPTFGLDFW